MTKRAWTYVFSILTLGAILYAVTWIHFFAEVQPSLELWLRFLLLTAWMTAAQLFRSEANVHQIYHPNLMFAFAGVLLLPPALFCTMIVISHVAEWAKERLFKTEYLRSWYLQPFNMSMHILIGCVTQALLDAMLSSQQLSSAGLAAAPNGGDLAFLVFTLTAAGIYLLLNHFLVGSALVLARRIPWEDSGILDSESLLIDFAMLVMGITVATLADNNLWLILPAMAPLYLIYRALAIPNLKRQASTDSKTGLWNSEHFRKVLESEMTRSMRFSRPMVVVVADLDLLRNINNVYGHLAGDVVLVGVAKILRENLRDVDTVCRFGGEEFAILMPETVPEQALPRIENIRQKIAQAKFFAPLTNQLVKATMSFGITGIAITDRTTIDIIHRADMAVYTAKMRGRNQTCLADAPLPARLTLEERLMV